MRGHAAALLVQYERSGNPGSLRRALATLPAQYAQRWLRRTLRGRGESDLLLAEETRGFASGLLFYLRAARSHPTLLDKNPCVPGAATPAVSVIIPARNAAATLDAALASLRAQTVPDWEAIVVDDGSTDGTAAVAHAQASRDPRVHLLRAEAGGASAARNAGLAAARGRHLLFLDADDWVAPTHLERLLGLLAATPAATAAYCGYRRVMPDGSMGPATWRADIAAAPKPAFAHGPGTAIHAVLVDRDAVLAVGGFNPGLRTCEDWDL
jgi:hypothetical protein